MTTHITVKNTAEAWIEADKLFPCDYMHDSARSSRAGYDVYMSTNPDVYAWISDLGDRLEINLADGSTVNVWIVPEETESAEDSESAERGIMSKTVYFTPADIGRDLTRDDLHAADAIGYGLLEQVLPDLISFHDINAEELPAVLRFVADHFGLRRVEVCDCETRGCFAEESNAVVVDLSSFADDSAAYTRFREAVYNEISGSDDAEDTDAEKAAELAQMVEATRTAERMTVEAHYTPEVCQHVTVCIDGDRTGDSATIYDALRAGHPTIASDILTRYAESHGIRWGAISGMRVTHFDHGTRGRGHYIIEGYITARIGEELSFLASCAAVLSAEHDSNRQ